MSQTDIDYLSARAAEAERLAAIATVPEVSAVHLEFAATYRSRLQAGHVDGDADGQPVSCYLNLSHMRSSQMVR